MRWKPFTGRNNKERTAENQLGYQIRQLEAGTIAGQNQIEAASRFENIGGQFYQLAHPTRIEEIA